MIGSSKACAPNLGRELLSGGRGDAASGHHAVDSTVVGTVGVPRAVVGVQRLLTVGDRPGAVSTGKALCGGREATSGPTGSGADLSVR